MGASPGTAREVCLQGTVDHFSGIYAVINALAQTGWSGGSSDDDDATRIFTACCEALPKRAWPAVAWKGIHRNDLRRMVFRVAGELPGFPNVSEPFVSRNFRYHAKFWETLVARLGQQDIACAIVWLRRTVEQWVVVKHHPGGLRVIDSNPEQPESTYVLDANRVSSGAEVAGSSLWYLDRKSVLLFPKV